MQKREPIIADTVGHEEFLKIFLEFVQTGGDICERV